MYSTLRHRYIYLGHFGGVHCIIIADDVVIKILIHSARHCVSEGVPRKGVIQNYLLTYLTFQISICSQVRLGCDDGVHNASPTVRQLLLEGLAKSQTTIKRSDETEDSHDTESIENEQLTTRFLLKACLNCNVNDRNMYCKPFQW